MPYLNTDDGFPDHPKVDALSDGAFRLHVAGMHYCAKNTTDGLIPVGRVDRLKPGYKAGQLQELLDGRLWHEARGHALALAASLGREADYLEDLARILGGNG